MTSSLSRPRTRGARNADLLPRHRRVFRRSELHAAGFSADAVRAQVAAGRWRLAGRAVVTHTAATSWREHCAIALINCGRRSVLTSLTAAELGGLRGWHRDAIHVLVPAGARRPSPVTDCPVIVHRTSRWPPTPAAIPMSHDLAAALVIAASGMDSARWGCGLLAAAVQQRVVSPDLLATALAARPHARHHRLLALALADIAGGAHALSELDFLALCRESGLPPPLRQVARADAAGRRRYLDAFWRRDDGTEVTAEVDGALHLDQRQWWDDQARQNELALTGTLILRFPSAVVRTDPAGVARQLRKALFP